MAGNLYLYSSKKTEGIYCYTTSADGSGLPNSLSPWIGIGVLRPDQSPPHGMKRGAIDIGIAVKGYQLWRDKSRADKSVSRVKRHFRNFEG